MSQQEIKKIAELKKKLLKLRLDNSLGQLTDFSQIKKTKKEVAKIFTELNRPKNEK